MLGRDFIIIHNIKDDLSIAKKKLVSIIYLRNVMLYVILILIYYLLN